MKSIVLNDNTYWDATGVYDSTSHKTQRELNEQNDNAIAAKYTKPSTGIPKSDLTQAVRDSLDKADTALQQNQKGVAGGVAELDANGKVPVAQCPIEEDVTQATTDWLDEHIAQETGYVLDNTLTVSGAAADAKKTGDELSDLKSAITDVENDIYIFGPNIFNGVFENATINSSGEFVPLSSGVTNVATEAYSKIDPSCEYTFSCVPTPKNVNLYIYEYDSNKQYTSVISSSNIASADGSRKSVTVRTSVNGSYLRFRAYREGDVISNIIPIYCQLEKGDTATNYHEPGYKESKIENIEIKLENADLQIQSINIFGAEWSNGTINSSGVYVDIESGKNNAATKKYTEIKSTALCTFSCEAYQYPIAGYIIEYDSTKGFIKSNVFTIASNTPERFAYTFTTNENTKYIRMMTYRENADWNFITPIDPMIVYGESIEFVPYGDIYSIPALIKKVDNITDGYLGSYYDGYIQKKAHDIEERLKTAVVNGDAFYFITDMHWDKNAQQSPQLIKKLNSILRINKLFTGGDITSNGYSNEPIRSLQSAMNEKSQVYCITGNHEFLVNNTTYNEIYYMQSAMYDNNVIFGSREKNYYYFNNEIQKIRYIVLAAYGELIGGAAQSLYLDSDQLEWFRDVALNVQSGWTIIVLTHCMYSSPYSGGTWQNPVQSPAQDDNNFTDVIKDYMENGNGEIACIIEGHLHYDRIFEISGMPKIVATTCDKYLPWIEGGVNQEPWLDDRVLGTTTEQAFDVVILDKTQRTVTFVRVGEPARDGINNTFGNAVEYRTITY